MELDEDAIRRFARHIVLPEVGGVGQARLLAAKVLIVGAGGLGAPLALYLAAAGVGTLGLVDDDEVDLGNLQRQVAFTEADIGRPKVERLSARIAALNARTKIRPHPVRLGAENAAEIIARYDLVADGSDNFSTRATVAATCRKLGRTLVTAAVQGVEGQLTTFKPHEGPSHPCFRCLFPDEPDPAALPSCVQGGVLGPAAGVMATLQAVEVVKEILGGRPSLSGILLLYDALAPALERIRLARRADCMHGCTLDDAADRVS